MTMVVAVSVPMITITMPVPMMAVASLRDAIRRYNHADRRCQLHSANH